MGWIITHFVCVYVLMILDYEEENTSLHPTTLHQVQEEIRTQGEIEKEELHRAILSQALTEVERILRRGVVTMRDYITNDGNTALHVAVGTWNTKFLKGILKLATQDEQPLNIRNMEGSTPLRVAVTVGYNEAAKMLVEAEESKKKKEEEAEEIKKREENAKETNRKEEKKKERLYAAILREKFNLVESVLNKEAVTLGDKITINGNTALHIAVGTSKNREFLEKILNLATRDNHPLDTRNSEGSTPLHVAAIVGNTVAAKIMLVDANLGLLLAEDNEGKTPIARALSSMHTDAYLFWWDHFQRIEKGDLFDGCQLLLNMISSIDYRLALKMFDKISIKLSPRDKIGAVLMAIAQNFSPKVEAENFPPQAESYVYANGLLHTVWYALMTIVENFSPYIKAENFQRQVEVYFDAKKLLRTICSWIKNETESMHHHDYYNNAIFEATRQNEVEFVKEIVSEFPYAILMSTNEDRHNIIQCAVINRSEKVYNLLYQMSEHKHTYKTIKDPLENNLLHLAARLAPANKLSPISGAALKIQFELQWFKEVERFVCPLNVIQKNSYGETPEMIFTKEHKELVIEGEKWMKEAAQSYTITATLMATIMFAATITVPGGYYQNSGIPMFLNVRAFIVFAVSVAISLFTSVTSLLLFLSILTARFSEQDFLLKLPKRLIIGLATLFISTAAMLVAFAATFCGVTVSTNV